MEGSSQAATEDNKNVATASDPSSLSVVIRVPTQEVAPTDGRQRRTKKAIVYIEEDGSDDEQAIVLEKKRRARQLDSDLRVDVGYPQLEQLVGRRINQHSGTTEYLCKFLGRSYLHLWWLNFKELELFIPEGYQKQHRVQVYERKLRRDGYQELDDVDDVEANKVTIEKILSHKVDPRDHLDEQIERRRAEGTIVERYPMVTDYFLLTQAEIVSERLMGIVKKLLNENGGEIFAQPVDTDDLPEYLNIVLNPMDLGTISTRLSRESYYIGPAAHSLFASDVRLVFTNCKLFNTEGSDIWKLADELLQTFEKWYYEWILCPTAWLKLESTGNVEQDRRLNRLFRENGEESYDAWIPWRIGCAICQDEGDSEHLLLCDRCDGEIHMQCSTPEITDIPENEWFCSYCVARNEYEKEVKSMLDEKKESDEIKQEDKKEEVKQEENDPVELTTVESDSTELKATRQPHIPMIVSAPAEGIKKFNRNTAGKKETTVTNDQHRATFFLVKWVGLSIRYSTWERPEDIGDDEQIQRYFTFSRIPSVKELRETTCQLPCCARRLQVLIDAVAQRNCEKDNFCTRGFQHEGECSREVHIVNDKQAYGTDLYRHLRMIEQVKTQLFAFHCLLNNHTPDKEVLKQCGLATHAFVSKKYLLSTSQVKGKAVMDGEDDDYSEAEEDDEASESEDDYEDEVDEEDTDFRIRKPVLPSRMAMMYPGLVGMTNEESEEEDDDDEEDNEEEGSVKKNAEDEVCEVVSALVEHIALGYDCMTMKTVQPELTYRNNQYQVTSFQGRPSFTEYCVALRRLPFGLGMRLGVTDDGNVQVMGYQQLPNGTPGPAESSQMITIGDVLVAVNSKPVAGLVFREIIAMISTSPAIVLFHFHSQRPAYTFPPFCQPRHVLQQAQNVREDAVNPSEYIMYSYNQYQPLLQVGTHKTSTSSSTLSTSSVDQAASFITPTGPMQHLYAGIVDNSIDPHEHFASFLPDKGLKESKRKTEKKKTEFIPYEHSPTFKNGRTLRSYQVEGLNWMISCWKQQRSCILADEMGLGKTVQVVSLIDHLRSEESIRGPYLIVVPLSTIQHWRREIENWTDLNVCVYHDIGDHRGGKFTAKDMRALIRTQEWYYPNLINSIFKFDILLTTFETILADFEEIEHIHWRLVVVDEAHRLKSAGSRVLKQMRVLHCDRKLLLTGTPLQNNTQELWVLLNYLEPVKFDSLEEFNTHFGTLQSQEQVIQLQQLLGPYLLRRVKEDVEKSIPPKEETIVSVELTTLQKQYYRAIYDKNKSFLYRGSKNSLPTLNNIQLQLRKCCNHPFLIKGVEERELEDVESIDIMEKTIACSGKMVLVSKLLPKLKREGHKVLIFSQFLKQLDMLERYCECNQFGYERLDGGTSGSFRQNAIDRFSRPNSKTFVFLLSTKAGGVGINLIAADTVIIFDSDWNPQNDLQAQARCHRIGQKKSVQIYRLITRNTYESEMFERASRKLGLEHAVLGTASFNDTEQIDNKPSAEQLVELLKRGAYALMEEDDSASKAFAERDIETILKENAHVRVVGTTGGEEEGKSSPKKKKLRKSLGGIAFDRSSFVADGATHELSVDDPNFWEKVLPGAMSVEMLSIKLEDGSVLATRQAKIKFISNLDLSLNELVQDLKDSERNIEHEYDIAIQVLHTILTKHKNDFSTEQLDVVKSYLGKLEKSRVRSCRLPQEPIHKPNEKKRTRKPREIEEISTEEDDEDEHVSSRIKRKKEVSPTRNVRNKPTLGAGPFINESDDLCTMCGDGGLILLCDGPCHRSFHLACIGMDSEPDDEHWLCPDCAAGQHTCLICKQVGKMGGEFGVMQCSVAKCGRFYHKGCLSKHSRVDWMGKKRFRCPSHFCHGCSQEQQIASSKRKKSKATEPIISCLHCSQSFHPKCIQANANYIRLSTNLMICANHLQSSSKRHEDVQDNARKRKREESNRKKKHVAYSTVDKVCAMCSRGDETTDISTSDKKRRKSNNTITAPEGPFLDTPIRLRYSDKPQELVHIHMNCALHSPEVFVKPDGSYGNIIQAIKRGRRLKCTWCKEFGATVGCVDDLCQNNFHLRCALEEGGKFLELENPYSLYCRIHAKEKEEELSIFCVCRTKNADESLSLECGSCLLKYHPKCVNISERQAIQRNKDKTWLCPYCSGEASKDDEDSSPTTTKRNESVSINKKPEGSKKTKKKRVRITPPNEGTTPDGEKLNGKQANSSRSRTKSRTPKNTKVHTISPHMDGSDCSISDAEE